MLRTATTGSFCLLALLGISGCNSFFTARAIDAFTSGVKSGQLADLKHATSADFQQKALRLDSSVTALKVLPLPTEDGTVTQVEETGNNERLATVTYEDGRSPVKFRLKREANEKGSRAWVVDDVILTQSRPGRDEPLTKSVTEQMDLLLTVQQFLVSWREGGREEAQAVLHPQLQNALANVSPVHLAQITNKVLEGAESASFRPEAHIQAEKAAVFLPRGNGQLVVELLRLNGATGEWRVSEIALRDRRDGKAEVSITKLAELVGTATQFVNAYEAADREKLSKLSTEPFYKQALIAGDLKSFPLPASRIFATPFEITESGERSDLLFDAGEQTYLFSIAKEDAPAAVKPGASPQKILKVQEVTTYERDGSQIKPLSSVLTAQAVVEVFADAYAQHDLPLLAQLSTADFNRKVWGSLASPELLPHLAVDGVPAAPPRIVTTVFQGPVTEITVTQGTRALTYVLHSGRGRPQVDDVLIPSNNRPGSLKTVLEAVVPAYNFAFAWDQRQKDLLQKNSSEGLRRMIWLQSNEIPEINVTLSPYVRRPLSSMKIEGTDLVLRLGDDVRGASVRLVTEGNRYLVQDFQLSGREFADGRMEVIGELRNRLSRGTIVTSRTPRRETTGGSEGARIVPAAHAEVTPDPGEPGRIEPLLRKPVSIPGA